LKPLDERYGDLSPITRTSNSSNFAPPHWGVTILRVKVVSNFASAFAISLVIAALSFIFFFGAPRLSLALTLVWIGIVVFGFTKFKWRAFWFLLGTVGYVFFVLYRIALGCAQNVKNCP
jgi:hypothetical protein